MLRSAGASREFPPRRQVDQDRAGVRDTDSGIASATLNVGQQIGGSIGLAAPRLACVGDTAHPFPDRQPDRIIALPGALHDTTALRSIAQIPAQSTDARFLAGGTFALAAVVLARAAINVKRPEAQPPRD
jgi:hypothetical protein